MKLDNMGLAFSEQCLCAALLVSLLSVWALVGLFHHINRYTRRDYFSIWTGAWLFYALWLTSGLCLGDAAPGSALFAVNQCCVSASAVLLLWGSLRLLRIPVPRRLFVVVAVFIAAWIVVSPRILTNPLQVHLPVFVLLGLSSPFAGVCFLRLQKEKSFMGVGMLSLGFLLWDIYIGSYPFPRDHGNLYSAGFFIAALLQLFIAISMVFLLVQEVRREARQVRAEIEAVRLEKEALLTKVNATKETCQNLYDEMRAKEESGRAMAEQHREEQAVVERERIQALGQMAGDVAHDINNALSPITAYSELLLSTLPNLPEVPRQRLEKISKAAEDVAQIVAHMRDFYRAAPPGEPSAKINVNPCARPGLDLDPDLSPEDADASCRPLRILCIDDEPQLRQVMHDVLVRDRHQVTVAKGGREGLSLFRSNLLAGVPYEVIITDLGMPDLDGHAVARAVKAESPQTPVIMLTGWGAMAKTDGQTAPEVDAVIGKPPRMQELSNLLFQITERSAT